MRVVLVIVLAIGGCSVTGNAETVQQGASISRDSCADAAIGG